jgi:hypothetical protein
MCILRDYASKREQFFFSYGERKVRETRPTAAGRLE